MGRAGKGGRGGGEAGAWREVGVAGTGRAGEGQRWGGSALVSLQKPRGVWLFSMKTSLRPEKYYIVLHVINAGATTWQTISLLLTLFMTARSHSLLFTMC